MRKGFLAMVTLSAAMWMHGAMAQETSPNSLGPKIVEACGNDIKQYCADVERGGGRILRCLRDNQSKLSASCKATFAELRSQRERKN
jgi:hypothetical protein